ncbi:capping protein inhibiting regulator of actin dynamics-like isoform X3 [Acropora millepora]|uniref:capping protein inhibiting regulator of actin dynamics-like isoform X3 n=1 Tax=Acropora millepora TaxID=45264 RepID=UPI001CF49C36|nr:capping protein inhibiting regulator of actin dynamics-like isoform X3 [Acropora millepora]
MPTCMHIAYHNEAKRKQRIMERKHAALQRIVVQQQLEEEKKRADQERQKLQKVEQEKERARTREEYIRSMGRTGRAGVVNANYVNMIAEQKLKISQRDLRHQEKILRDHCLVMGHVNDKFLA